MRTILPSVCLTLFACMLALSETRAADVWIGTTTGGNSPSQGIYHAHFDAEEGKLSKPTLAAEVDNPGFLALHPDGEVLYTAGSIDGTPMAVAYRIGDQGKLELLNSQPIGDGGAAHLATDRSGKVLLTAQYGGGSVAIFPLAENGSIQPRSELHKHHGGSGVVADRQDSSHAHWVGTSPDNQFVFVPDLGLDQVVIYRLDAEQATLAPHWFGQCPPGAGLRHMKFSADGKFIYVLNELALSVTVFAYDAAAGKMTPVQTIPTLSEEQKAGEQFVSGSEIRVHPSGKFVYAANRGHDSLTVFQVDPSSGQLSLVEIEPIRGSWPRNFNLDSTGNWLVAAGRDSHTLAVFAIDPTSGALHYTLHMVHVPTPICVLFGP